jgi:hypothetical protein
MCSYKEIIEFYYYVVELIDVNLIRHYIFDRKETVLCNRAISQVKV